MSPKFSSSLICPFLLVLQKPCRGQWHLTLSPRVSVKQLDGTPRKTFLLGPVKMTPTFLWRYMILWPVEITLSALLKVTGKQQARVRGVAWLACPLLPERAVF